MIERAVGLMEKENAWSLEAEASEMLEKLGCSAYIGQKMGTLSGGQKKRVGLARLLLTSPDIVLLDEPTNHLSLPGVEWLEGFLNQRRELGVIFTSHDRIFIDNVCTSILEIDGKGNAFKFDGSFTHYLEGREERLYARQRDAKKAEGRLRKETEWMRRQPKARSTKNVARQKQFYDLSERSVLEKEFSTTMDISNQIVSTRLGSRILEFKNVTLGYGPKKRILNDFSYSFDKRERIGLVGPNGVGKTTFLRAITGEAALDSGEIEIGETVKIAHFSQEHAWDEFENMRAIEYMQFLASNAGHLEGVTKLTERFQFSGDRQHTYIKDLSGGEKRRLQLLSILAEAPNFLLLDEPTNDLDLESISTFEEYLMEFPGVVLATSHDRAFMNGLISRFFVFEGNGHIRFHEGLYSEVIEEKTSKKITTKKIVSAEKEKQKQQRQSEKETQRARRKHSELEDKIGEKEERVAELEQMLIEVGADVEKAMELGEEREKALEEVEKLYEDYEKLEGLL